MHPLISVIIPVFNHKRALAKSFASLVKQTYRPVEAIIVDDGSSDAPEDVFESLMTLAADSQITLRIERQSNRGAAAARNSGLALARGEYIICWDADTIGRPEMLDRLFSALQADPDATFAYCGFKFGWKTFSARSFNATALRRYNYIDTTSLVRRAQMPLFDETLKRFQDWDIWLTLLAQGKRGVAVPGTFFKKIVRGRTGISTWFPSFFLHLPWRTKQVKAYETARQILLTKHGLLS